MLILTLPYSVKDMEYYEDYYDEIIIPDLGRPHPKSAITKCNQWMIDTADYILAYVERKSGGAFKAISYAERNGKSVMNIASLTE